MKSRSGFTLIELMVVVIVISIIASIVVLSYDNQMKSARDQSARQGLISLSSGLDKYYEENGVYPFACSNASASFFSCSHTSDYPGQGATAPDTINEQTTSEQLNDIMPDIANNLTHPRLKSSTPVNRLENGRVSADTYYVNSLDSYATFYNAGLTNLPVNFYNTDGTVLTCRYTLRSYNTQNNTAKRPYQYVIGYFSEVEKAWKFYQSKPRVDQNIMTWNSTNAAACAAEDIGTLKS